MPRSVEAECTVGRVLQKWVPFSASSFCDAPNGELWSSWAQLIHKTISWAVFTKAGSMCRRWHCRGILCVDSPQPSHTQDLSTANADP